MHNIIQSKGICGHILKDITWQRCCCMRQFITMVLFYVCSIIGYAQVIINPIYDRTNFEMLHPHIDKVELKKDSTKVYCSVSYQESWNYNIPKTMFIEDLRDNKKYRITKCIGLPFEPEERFFNYGGTFRFVFCFPHIAGLQSFNMIEDTSKDRFFNIYGIDISKSYLQAFEETEYKRFKNMSDFYKSSGDVSKYIEFEEKEMSAAQYVFGMKSIAADACYNQLAHYYNEAGDYTKAIEFGIQALECDSIQFGVENKEYPVYANTLGNLSQFYLNAGKDDESLQCILKCIRIRKSIEDKQGYLNELYSLLLTGHDNDGIIKRIAVVNKELESLPNFIDAISMPIAELYKLIAGNYKLLDDKYKAIEYCNKAISIMNSTGHNNNEVYAEILGLKCKCQQQCGLKDEAIATGESAKRLYESLSIRSLKFAELLGDLAWVYGLALNYEKSVQLQLKAAEIYQNAKDWISLAEVYNSISHYYQSAEKLDNAEQYIKKAINVLDEHDNAEQYIVDAVEQTGDSMMNNPFALTSIKQRTDTDKSFFYQTLARIYQKQGNYADAINAELENEKILKNMGDNQMYAVHLMSLSEYYLRNDQIQDAKTCSEQSAQLLSNDNRISLAWPKIQLAIIGFQAGDTIKAIRYAEESVSVSSSHDDNECKIAAQSILSYFYWKNRQLDKAESCLSEELDYLKYFISKEQTGMTTEQKQRLWDKHEHDFLLYRSIIEKSDRKAALLSKLYDYVLFSKSFLLDTEIQQDTNSISRLNVKWNDIQQHLSNDAIAVEFISTMEDEGEYNTYHALVIDKNFSSPRMITLYSESKLEDIKKTDVRNIRDIVGELIWKPILAQYPTVRDVYFSPDGILHVLPIEYYSAEGTNSMSEHYNMYRLSSTKELIREIDKRQPNSAVLYGGLDYNQIKKNTSETNSSEMSGIWRGIAERGGFDPLFNTSLETQEIKDLLTGKNISTTLYCGETGTEESFRNLSGQSHSLIHLATHGMYINPEGVDTEKNENNFAFLESLVSVNDPVKEDVALTHSFLVMAGGNRVISRIPVYDKNNDGILTSKEISQLDLSGTDLVVLSACETALGDLYRDGIYGLQRGFKKAGVKTILMSLDKVDDEATRVLMVEFYRNLMSGKTKHQSLKEAQQYLRKIENGKYDDPKYWASFIMLDGLN